MTAEERKRWIDNATYEQLLAKWRFEPTGSAWFQGDIGTYYGSVMNRKREELTDGQAAAASKRVGWN